MSARATHVLNRVLLAAIFGAILWFVLTVRTTSPRTEQAPVAAPLAPVATPAPVMAPGAALSVPVAGVAPTQLMDTFTQARGSGRSHDAIDIMAPRGTPVLAAAEARVERLFFRRGGWGITVY